jgi:hypothetical protein
VTSLVGEKGFVSTEYFEAHPVAQIYSNTCFELFQVVCIFDVNMHPMPNITKHYFIIADAMAT